MAMWLSLCVDSITLSLPRLIRTFGHRTLVAMTQSSTACPRREYFCSHEVPLGCRLIAAVKVSGDVESNSDEGNAGRNPRVPGDRIFVHDLKEAALRKCQWCPPGKLKYVVVASSIALCRGRCLCGPICCPSPEFSDRAIGSRLNPLS